MHKLANEIIENCESAQNLFETENVAHAVVSQEQFQKGLITGQHE